MYSINQTLFMRKLYAFLFTALVLFVLANHASAQNYTFTTSAGNSIDPGTSLVPGSQADDATIAVTLPFSYSAYGTVYSSVRVGTNGNLQFTTASTAFTNACPLPSAALDRKSTRLNSSHSAKSRMPSSA